ncbi:MAG TPA: transglutaminaseTgpA domain-containing protein [Gaiellaceae bacterium]|nr:transglutaminaseTgpA domain-containing protein [Gaiellaceae bacterium]
MRRTALVALVPAVVVAAAWLRLEQPHDDPSRAAGLVLLALAPALVPRGTARVGALVVALVLGARWTLGLPLRHPGRFWSHFSNGFLDFYDVKVPFDPRVHAEMRGVILVAVFGFVLVLGLAVAWRRPFAAALVVLVGAGWPATLAGNTGGLGRGGAILLAELALLAGLTARRIPRAAIPAIGVLIVAAVVASSSSAVAKSELVAWQRWDFYNAPAPPVSVSYVWDAQYNGLRFPRTRTTVLEIKAPPASLYWRAALLDVFGADRWTQGRPLQADALEPAAAADRRRWVRQDVTVEALADTRLVGASMPMAFSAGEAPIRRSGPGVALLPSGLTRGLRYTVWSYAPQPRPRQLARSLPLYPRALVRPRALLDVWPGVSMPPFGVAGRQRRVATILDAHPEIARYIPLEKAAFAVAGDARNPYAATVSLESWFRSRGGFTYTNRPAIFAEAPLVGFVVQTRAGYCQYFAGAMALMLRYLGVPARVVVGFSSGTYDRHAKTWTVTDHDAHAWVEAWFRGYGWLPFDPTPSAGRPERGRLDAAYSAASARFSLRKATGSAGNAGPPVVRAQSDFRHGETGGPSHARGVSASTPSSSAAPSLLELLAALLAAALGGIAVTKIAARRVRYLSRDPRHVAAACRQELADFLLDQRIDAARSATLHELGALVRNELAVDPDAFVASATAARFGPPAGARHAAREARRELRALMRVIRARLSARERVRGLVSLRSLGFAP